MIFYETLQEKLKLSKLNSLVLWKRFNTEISKKMDLKTVFKKLFLALI